MVEVEVEVEVEYNIIVIVIVIVIVIYLYLYLSVVMSVVLLQSLSYTVHHDINRLWHLVAVVNIIINRQLK